ncbi:Long chain base biosynthesis protein 1 [Zea mays]|uniref:serine C-palmitoyltransferase n=1 Tax=Zea mays TaxID=4577 RepID=A0A1D6F6B9_MAIZE|nr:Long chain base biosynthesis protein 1 [Zea mays]
MQYGLQLFTMLSSYDCIIYDLLRIRINPSIFLLYSAAGPHTIVDGKEVVNFASANYLSLIGNEKIIDSCISSLEKYGVGSCGPCGFYGTTDVHLDCESKIAKFLGTPDSILYSYGISTIFNVIPAFCKKGDIIVADEGVHWAVKMVSIYQEALWCTSSTMIWLHLQALWKNLLVEINVLKRLDATLL